MKKVVLAYSGGLDTSITIPWLKENYDIDVIAVCGNVGQDDDMKKVHDKAIASGAIKAYCVANDFAKEMVLPFMHKAPLLAPKGEIALIFNTKVLTNTGGTYQNFRQWLFNENYVEKIYK